MLTERELCPGTEEEPELCSLIFFAPFVQASKILHLERTTHRYSARHTHPTNPFQRPKLIFSPIQTCNKLEKINVSFLCDLKGQFSRVLIEAESKASQLVAVKTGSLPSQMKVFQTFHPLSASQGTFTRKFSLKLTVFQVFFRLFTRKFYYLPIYLSPILYIRNWDPVLEGGK